MDSPPIFRHALPLPLGALALGGGVLFGAQRDKVLAWDAGSGEQVFTLSTLSVQAGKMSAPFSIASLLYAQDTGMVAAASRARGVGGKTNAQLYGDV